MALAHTVGSKVEEAYRRTDLFERRRSLMQDWAAYCGGEQRRTLRRAAQCKPLPIPNGGRRANVGQLREVPWRRVALPYLSFARTFNRFRQRFRKDMKTVHKPIFISPREGCRILDIGMTSFYKISFLNWSLALLASPARLLWKVSSAMPKAA